MPSISRSGERITRCLNTGVTERFTSSGVTKSRPLMAAKALADFKMAKDARGEPPKYKCGCVRDFTVICAM